MGSGYGPADAVFFTIPLLYDAGSLGWTLSWLRDCVPGCHGYYAAMDTLKAEKTFKVDDVIMAQGDHGTCAYFIQAGRVGIVVEKPDGTLLDMGTRGAGNIIGEMAIIDDQPRSATVRCLEDCTLLEVTKEDFARSVRGTNPIVRLVVQVILMRYRDILRRSTALLDDGAGRSPEQLEREYAEQINVVEAIKMANEFKVAIAAEQLLLHYQPIISVSSNRVVGMEALMRWQHPQRGMIAPDAFIPMAEDSGLIVEASRGAMREVCRLLNRLDHRRPDLKDLFVSVNLSAADFDDEQFLEYLHATLDEYGIAPHRIHLEITERVLMKKPKNVRAKLDDCRARGMKVIIDDFGTGYSSLSYLHQYPIDTLKIDRSFIHEMRRDDRVRGLVKSILTLSDNMSIRIIAEGIETEAEAKTLADMHCDLLQGYYFSRPLEESFLFDLLDVRNPH